MRHQFCRQTSMITGYKKSNLEMSNAKPHMSFHTNLHSCGIALFILQSRSAFMWTAVKSQPIRFQWGKNGYSLRAANCMRGAFWFAIKVQMQLIFQTINIHLETTTKCQSKRANIILKALVKRYYTFTVKLYFPPYEPIISSICDVWVTDKTKLTTVQVWLKMKTSPLSEIELWLNTAGSLIFSVKSLDCMWNGFKCFGAKFNSWLYSGSHRLIY